MAQKTEVKLLDDLDRHEHGEDQLADVTTEFALDGKTYQIDLSKEHDGELRAGLERFIAAARKVPSSVARRRPTVSADRLNRTEAADIRAWAQGRGMEISKQGRIPAEIRTAYFQAHPNKS